MRNRATERTRIGSPFQLIVILSLALGGCSADGLAGPDDTAVMKIPIHGEPPIPIVIDEPPRPCTVLPAGGCR
jgi:hypothetical protein